MATPRKKSSKKVTKKVVKKATKKKNEFECSLVKTYLAGDPLDAANKFLEEIKNNPEWMAYDDVSDEFYSIVGNHSSNSFIIMVKRKNLTNYFEMLSEDGNRKCENLVNKIARKILNSKRNISANRVESWIQDGINKIAQEHSEVCDSDSTNIIIGRIEKVYQSKYGRDKELER